MSPLIGFHHIALIVSNYEVSKHFYINILGAEVIARNLSPSRNSYKLDLRFRDGSQIELFSFPITPPRPTTPEACGLRHLAFKVDDATSY